jgi:transposase
MQADATGLYAASRRPGAIIEASCGAHARRKFFDLALINKALLATEAIERINALFRDRARDQQINGASPQERKRVCNEGSRPLVASLETWLRRAPAQALRPQRNRQGDTV